jgi:hypothetical protein
MLAPGRDQVGMGEVLQTEFVPKLESLSMLSTVYAVQQLSDCAVASNRQALAGWAPR